MTPAKTREALQELVGSDGWQLFRLHVEYEWRGPWFFDLMNAAINADMDPLVVMRTAIAVRQAVAWPEEMIRELKGEVDE